MTMFQIFLMGQWKEREGNDIRERQQGNGHKNIPSIKPILNWISIIIINSITIGTFLVVQWLRLHAPNARGPGSIPGQGTRSCTTKELVCCNKMFPFSNFLYLLLEDRINRAPVTAFGVLQYNEKNTGL